MKNENTSDRLPKTDTEADLIKPAIAELLQAIPEVWAEFDSDALTASKATALFLLTAAGMVERRGRLHLEMFNHPTCIELTFEATGEYGPVEALKSAVASAWESWRESFARWQNGEQRNIPPFHAESIKPQEWRLTEQGVSARNMLQSESRNVYDFVLKRGHYGAGYWVWKYMEDPGYVEKNIPIDPNWESLSRPPMRGAGRLVTLKKIEKPSGPQAVSLTNWGEGADTIAATFGKMFRPMFEKMTAEMKANSGQPASGIDPEQAGKVDGRQKQTPTEKRDAWIYNECCKMTAYNTIILQLGKKPDTWERIESVQGIKDAATRWAEKNNLTPIPVRQKGRKKGKKNLS